MIDTCDRTDTSQKQLDGNYQGRQEAMDHKKQAGSIARVVEIVKYTFDDIRNQGGCAEQEQVLLKRRLDALFRKKNLRCWVVMSIGSEL